MIRKFIARLPKLVNVKDKVINISNQRETYIVGYPKTGNTWVRVMLGKYVQLLTGRDEKLPLPLFDQFEDLGLSIPLIQVTHGPLEWSVQTASDLTLENVVLPYCKSKVVLLVRNIPDVLVSLYWQEKTQVTPPYPNEISDFVRDLVFGVDKALAFYRNWNEGRSLVSKIMLLRYEDIRTAPAAELKHLLGFLEISVNEDYIEQAVTFSDFNNMRKIEVDNKETHKLVYSSSGLPIFGTGDTTKTEEAFHVRKGQIGGYREYLSESDIQFLREKMHGEIPNWYKYPDGFWDEKQV